MQPAGTSVQSRHKRIGLRVAIHALWIDLQSPRLRRGTLGADPVPRQSRGLFSAGLPRSIFQLPQSQSERRQLLFDLVQAGLPEVLAAEQLILGAGGKLADR